MQPTHVHTSTGNIQEAVFTFLDCKRTNGVVFLSNISDSRKGGVNPYIGESYKGFQGQYAVLTQSFNDICLETSQVLGVDTLCLGAEGCVLFGVEEEVNYVCQGYTTKS